ncbi:hypothetical protein [Polaribacter dokdonensis]|jgi:hypothetical protein|uniref:Transmembrane protein n=1 Tax=Polaribacter dokdonensis DSW-5 TaxID=1300348 RepID=A0A0M9CI55_9FLAO|nr:hypothetical protein [Polaribacter dokdonensis]KOY53101.1 hypothetical protein I602_2661 [Polaribacter dokdonensis DSW-5]SEE57158.1 hypothetical protein SAMN05444353_2436 [Polaribacter dokdonensis DSW-5]|tara:strand:+ start:19543 stop:20004 length:462 start_codon:yes stop_codon:yes gene_type:complete
MENNEKTTLRQAIHFAKVPVIISLFLSPIRYTLELIGLPENAIFIIGLLWLTLGFAIYLGIKTFNEKKPYQIILLSLIIFSPISRIPVAILWWIDTKWEIGTHYGLYYDSFGDALLNHVIYGSLVQLIPAFLLGTITIAIMRYRKTITQNKSL